MAKYPPLWNQALSYPAQLDRQLLGTLWPSGGVLGGAVTAVANTMTVSIGPGSVAVPLQPGQGSALCHWDAPEVVTLDPGPASGTTRVDLIVAQVRDASIDAGANNDWQFLVVKGTPATMGAESRPGDEDDDEPEAELQAVAPAVPANALAIAQVTVPATAVNLNGATVSYGGRGSLNAGMILASANIAAPAYSTSSGSFVLVDTTNAVLRFVVPGSGNVLMRASTLWNNGAAGVRGLLAWSSQPTPSTNFFGPGMHTGSIDGTAYKVLHSVGSAAPGTLMTAYLQYAATNVAGAVTINADALILEAIAL